jgi:hypothetical protein
MQPRKQLAHVIDELLASEEVSLEQTTLDEYKKLSEACDEVLEKIRKRKQEK